MLTEQHALGALWNKTKENDWYTPPEYIEIARRIMGSIDLDPASSARAQRVVKANLFYDKVLNGLIQPWNGNVWMNPPFSAGLIKPFCERLITVLPNITQAMVLTHSRTDTKWFRLLADNADLMCFITKRMKFWNDAGEGKGSPNGQILFGFKVDPQKFYSELHAKGLIVCKYNHAS